MKTPLVCVMLASLMSHGGLAATTNAVQKLYAYCVQEGDATKRALPEEARLLRELGYDGGGYPLWFGDARDHLTRSLAAWRKLTDQPLTQPK